MKTKDIILALYSLGIILLAIAISIAFANVVWLFAIVGLWCILLASLFLKFLVSDDEGD